MPDLTASHPLPARMDQTPSLADEIVERLGARTVLDAGCGDGRLVQALRERGVDAFGYDASDEAVASAPQDVQPYLWVAAPGAPLDDRYDVVTSSGGLGDPAAALTAIAAATDRILLPSPPDGETAGLLAGAGFVRDPAVTGRSVLFERRPTTVAEVVEAYEQALARARRDHAELERLRAREERATEAMTQTLRLRDLLIVSERALGQVKGEVAFLRDQLHGYDELVEYHEQVMASTTWKIGWKAMGPVRRLRRLLGR